MGTSLNGLTPSATYSGLIKFGDNSAIGASLKYLSDGDGNDTLLAMSTTSLNIGATNIAARVGIKGSGSTSATSSLIVQNSAGTESFRISDNGNVLIAANGFYSGGNGSNINSGLKLFNGSDGSLEIVQDWSPGFNSATLGGINFYTNGSIQQRINSKGNVLFGEV